MDLIEWNDLYFLGGALFLEVELFNWAPLGRFLLGVEVTTLVFMVCGLGLAAQVDVKLVPEAGRWLGPRPIPIWWDGDAVGPGCWRFPLSPVRLLSETCLQGLLSLVLIGAAPAPPRTVLVRVFGICKGRSAWHGLLPRPLHGELGMPPLPPMTSRHLGRVSSHGSPAGI